MAVPLDDRDDGPVGSRRDVEREAFIVGASRRQRDCRLVGGVASLDPEIPAALCRRREDAGELAAAPDKGQEPDG